MLGTLVEVEEEVGVVEMEEVEMVEEEVEVVEVGYL